MKDFFKKVFVLMASFFMAAGVVTPIAVKAESTPIIVDTPYGLNPDVTTEWTVGLTQTASSGVNYDCYARFYINGQKVYCVEPLHQIVEGTANYDVTDLDVFTGSAETSRIVGWISSLGYGYVGDTTDEMDFATQIRIWQEIEPGLITDIHPAIQAKIDQINNRLAAIETAPSFDDTTVELKNFGKDNGVTLTDSTGTFSNYEAYRVTGIHAEQSGNNLLIWAEETDSLENPSVEYRCFAGAEQGTSVAYYSPTSQGVAYLRGKDPNDTIVNVNFTVDFTLVKKDKDTKGRAQGDATFENTRFTLTDETTGEVAGEFIMKADGTSNTIKGLAPNHAYSLHETQAGEGYKVNKEDTEYSSGEIIRLVEANGHGEVALDVDEDVITGKFSVKKYLVNSDESDFMQPEKNAEFTAILNSYVTKAGGFDKARENIKNGSSGLTEKEYAIIVTDENGEATSGDLAYGTYMIQQTGGDAEITKLHPSFYFEVTEEDQPVVEYEISNIGKKYYATIVKEDVDSGKRVTLTSAKFKIKNESGEYVKQKVGSSYYDTFTVTSQNKPNIPAGTFYVETEEEGTTTTPLPLDPGKYTLEEVELPDGYIYPDEDLEFVLADEEVKVVGETPAEQDRPTIVLHALNTQPTGTIELSKKIEDYEADKSFIDRTDLSGIKFALSAKEDVIDPADGEVLYKAGELYGEFNLDEDGELELKNIPMGKYILKETFVPDGFVLDKTEHEVVFEQKDLTTKEYTYKLQPENKTTKLEVSKKSITGDDELEGAELSVKDSEGNVIDSWTSGDKPHTIEGLKIGETYTLSEDLTPLGYVKASSIDFKVNEDGSVTNVTMIDLIITLTKEDGDGHEVPGSHIQIFDENGEIVDEWTSTEEPHQIVGLEENKTYVMHEEGAPDGYYYTEDAEFTVTADGELDLVMNDQPIRYEIMKINDKDGSIVPGVTLELIDLDAEDEEGEKGVMVDGFPVITTNEPIELGSNLIAGHSYKLTETEWVNGVHKAVSLDFTVDMFPPDPDEKGEYPVVTITMVDEYNSLAFQKVDDTGKPLAGAEFQILEATYDEDGKVIPKLDDEGKQIVVAEFVSNDKPEGVTVDKNGVELASLLKGDDRDDETTGEDTDAVYLLHETKAPFGYETKTEDLSFTVTGTEEFPQVIRVTNKRHHFFVSAVKVDATDKTKLLKGAEITIYNAKTNEVAKTVDGKDAKGITDGRGVYMFELAYSEDGYYAMETGAPAGYLLNKDKHEVKLSEDYNFAKDNPIVIVVADTPQSKTAAGAPAVAGGMGVAAMAALAVLYVTRRKEEDAEAETIA